jgi:hypothetical protein
MTRASTSALIGLLALGLAACAQPPAGGGGGGAASISQAQGERACRAALAEFHGTDDVRIASSEPYQGGGRFVRGSVIANFDTGARELWQCIAYADGSAGEISYLGEDPNATGGTAGGTDPETAAQDACIRDVGREAGNSNLSILGSSFSEAGTEVIVGVGPQQAPWRCIAYRDGTTAGIEFMGDEGAL